MPTIDQEIALLSDEGRRRRRNDRRATVVLGGMCATVVATWGLGYLVRGWWPRDTAPGVYNPKARIMGDYFLTDWAWGCSIALGLLAAFLVFRPWSHRMGSVALGVLAAAGSGFVLWYSLQQWDVAEAKTVQVLRTTAYPWGETKYNCGRAEWTDSKGDLWAADTGRTSNSGHKSCDFVIVFKGWKAIGREYVADGAMRKHDGAETKVKILRDGTVVVTMDGSRVLSFPIKKPSRTAE